MREIAPCTRALFVKELCYTILVYSIKESTTVKTLLLILFLALPLLSDYHDNNQSMSCYEIMQKIQALEDHRKMNGGLAIALFFGTGTINAYSSENEQIDKK